VTRKITNLINSDLTTLKNTYGWEIFTIPNQNLIMITTPKVAGQSWKQYVQSLQTQGWAQYRDLPIQTGAVWEGFLYFGTADNRCGKHTGYVDNATIAGSAGIQINWSNLTCYQDDAQNPGKQKIPSFVKPYFIAQTNPAYQTKIKFDYDIVELIKTIAPNTSSGSRWDIALWDTAIWVGSTLNPSNSIQGQSGIGTKIAVAINGSSTGDTRLVGYDVVYQSGGFM
jgi:hypothetical protein